MTFPTSNPFSLPHHTVDLDSKFDSHCFEDLDVIDMSPAMERKDSFATSIYTPFSPQSSTNPWSDEAYSIPPASTSNGLTDRHINLSAHMADATLGSNNPFLQHQFQWSNPVYDRNGSKTPLLMPTVSYDYSPEFDTSASSAFPPGTAFGSSMPMLTNVRPASVMAPTAGASSLSTSPQPQPTKDWMSLAEQDLGSSRLPNKRVRPHSPDRPLSPGFSHRDGVRKKNARFDIPEGRSLHNIDQLIAKASAQGQETDVKELKQQKRLLRNRQAALDSRQRKKKHTEELEKEQKLWLEHRSDYEAKMDYLEEKVAQMNMRDEQQQQREAELMAQIHKLTHEKQSLIEEHTQDTMKLRTQINHLKDQVLQSSPTIPAQQSGMFGDFSDLDQLTGSEWDDLLMQGIDEDDTESPTDDHYNVDTPHQSTTTLVVGKPRMKDTSDASCASGGLLIMLLLYGAMIASKGTSGTTAPPMPGMSDEIRVASAHIVDNILKDGNTVQPASSVIHASRTSMQTVPSMPAWVQPQVVNHKKHSSSFNDFSSSSKIGSKLDLMASAMLAPSKEALAEAAFSLTPAQYNSLTSNDFTSHNSWEDEETIRSMNTQRKTLGETLRRMKEEAEGGSVAEVYKRSLLWDRIPEDVLHDFRRMVEENNRNERHDEKIMT